MTSIHAVREISEVYKTAESLPFPGLISLNGRQPTTSARGGTEPNPINAYRRPKRKTLDNVPLLTIIRAAQVAGAEFVEKQGYLVMQHR